MTFITYTKDEILDAVIEGRRVWKLYTAGAGHDDILLGTTYADALSDVLYHCELDELPEGWKLTEIDWEK